MSDKHSELDWSRLLPFVIIDVLILLCGLFVSIFAVAIGGGRDAWDWLCAAVVINTILMIMGVVHVFDGFD